jgi:type II secretory pathway component GspD/PulD (secretin)
LIAGLLLLLAAGPSLWAADREFVGVLALAVEKDVAEQLQLKDDQKQKLLDLIDRRESDVLEIALKLRNAPPAEREAALTPFRRESEAAGLKLLDDKQRAQLEQIRLRRAGAESLVEPEVVGRLKLNDEQKVALAKLAAERKEQLGRAGGQEREVLRNAFEQRTFSLLTPEQRTQWEQLAGVVSPTAATVARADGGPAVEDANTAAKATSGQTPAAASPTGTKAPTTAVAAKPVDKANVKLKFNFRFQPWGDVLDWFAQQADLSLVMDSPPPGTLNYTDTREYTPAEALDLMNGVLLTKGYTLVRRERMLMVVNLEDGIPPNLVPFVPLERIDTLGEFELATTLFPLGKLMAEDAQAEIQRLIGPQGAIVLLPKAGQLQVTETAGRLRLIRSVLDATAQLQASNVGPVRSYQPQHVSVDDALPLLRQLLDIPADAYAAADGSVRLAVDPLSGKLLVGGKPERVNQVDEIMKAVDVPAPAGSGNVETPQLEVYDVGVADSASVLAVLQTLMANFSDVRLTTDPVTGKLVALARPAQHATIRATLDQMQREARQVEVIRLQFVDPAAAVTAIGKLFGTESGATAAGAPKVEADTLTRQLLVRGSLGQIEQIKALLSKMGENVSDDPNATQTDSTNVRMLPLSPRTVRQALEQLESIWPTMRSNRIRVVQPSANIPSSYPAATDRRPAENLNLPVQQPTLPQPQPSPAPQAPRPEAAPTSAPAAPPVEKSAAVEPTPPKIRIQSVVLRREVAQAPAQSQPPVAQTPAGAGDAAEGEPAPIVVAPGPGGVMIASEDIEALNQFETLLTNLASRTATGGKEFTVFYLQNAGAVAAAETLEAVFGGGGSSAGGGSLLGDLAGMAMGGGGGGLMGAMLGGGGGGPSSSILSGASVLIVPDARLNALIVQATPTDLDLIEQLLRVVDQLDVPESTVNPRPRLIPVVNTGAAQIAEILREVYSERLAGSNRQRQPSPEEFMQMLRGGRSGSQSNRKSAAETQKVSIGVDARTNSLIVSAPQALYEEIEQLVKTLDHATSESNTAIRVVTLKRSNPATVQKALTAIVGEKAKTSETKPAGSSGDSGSSGSSSGSSGGRPPGSDGPDARAMQEMMKQRMEMFNNMRGAFGGGDRGSGFGGSRGGDSGRDRGR